MTSTPGLLRLKSTSSKISKPNKLKKKKPNTEPPAASSADSTATHPNSSNILGSSALLDIREKQPSKTAEELEAESDKEQQEPAVTKAHHNASDDEEGEATAVPKTEAELRYEERKRRRLTDRLKREGTKSHKERVEELNRYLSGLSEHHDMPRIGPG